MDPGKIPTASRLSAGVWVAPSGFPTLSIRTQRENCMIHITVYRASARQPFPGSLARNGDMPMRECPDGKRRPGKYEIRQRTLSGGCLR
jgi:hypothetical protein